MARIESTCLVAALVCSIVIAAFGAETSFLDALRKDPAHRLIVKAIDADKEGATKQLFDQNMPVTALVPTDAAFIQAGIKYKMGKSIADMQKIMSNTCLINAILKQHILPGVYKTTDLQKAYLKPSVLVTKKYDSATKKMITVNWPLKFRYLTSSKSLTVSSAAIDPKTNKPYINGTVIKPYDVVAGGGVMHNVDQLLLPTINMTRLMLITNCSATV